MNDMSQTTDMLDQLKSLSIDRGEATPVQSKRKSRQEPRQSSRGLPIKTLALLALISGGGAAVWYYQIDPAEVWGKAQEYAFGFLPTAKHPPVTVAAQNADSQALAPATPNVAAIVPVVAPAIIGSGYVVADRELELVPDIGGRLEQVAIKTGDSFLAGDVLAVLNSSAARADLNIARANLAQAQASHDRMAATLEESRVLLERTEKLAKRGSIPKIKVIEARFAFQRLERDLDVAAHAILIAQLEVDKNADYLDRHTITAPFSGVAVKRHLNPNDIVTSGLEGGPDQAIVSLIDPNALSIEVDVAESNLGAVHSGQKARVVLDAYPDRSFVARVTTISPKVSIQKGTVLVRLSFDTPPMGVFANMATKVTFDAPEQTAKLQ